MKRVTFIILCLEGAALSFSVAATAALVPSISAELGLSPFFTAKIVWLYMFPYGMAALVFGPLARSFAIKRIKLVCFLLFSLSGLMAGLASNIYLLFVARFLMGISGAAVIPLALILIAHHTPREQRGRSIGAFFGFTFIASLLGVFLSGIINWRFIYLIPALSGFLLWVLIYRCLPEFKEESGKIKFNYISALGNKNFFSIFFYIFVISLIYHGIQQWLAVYFSGRFAYSQFAISSLIALTSLSGVFGEFAGGWLSDLLGRMKTVNIGIICMALSVFCLTFKMPLLLLGAVMFLWGLGWTLNHAGLSTMLTELPDEFLNEAASLNSGMRFVSGGIGVSLGSMLLQKSFTLNFYCFGTGLILLLIFAKKILIKSQGG